MIPPTFKENTLKRKPKDTHYVYSSRNEKNCCLVNFCIFNIILKIYLGIWVVEL